MLLILHCIEDAHDARVLQLAHQSRLVHEHVPHPPGITGVLQQVGLQDFERDLDLLEIVERQIDVGSGAAAESSKDLIFVELFHVALTDAVYWP